MTDHHQDPRDATGPRLGLVVIAYEAEAFIENLLDRIPAALAGRPARLLISDDASSDRTAEKARAWADRCPERDVEVVVQPCNRGYGGNQKACYEWAAAAGLDIVVLIHGDAQYPPEMAESLVAPILDGQADAVYGSRMVEPGAARRGGMPMVRFIGNRALSTLLNRLSGHRFSEWFSGFRAYRVSALLDVDHTSLPDGFDFDTAITLRLLAGDHTIVEVPIPTRYADEVSRVPLLRTGLAGVRHGLIEGRRARAQRHRTSPAGPPTVDPRREPVT